MMKEDRYLSIQIIDKSSIKILVDLAKLIRKLLSNIPEGHLEGLDSIILVDRLLGTRHRDDAYLYRKKSKTTPANIELSLNGIYGNFPKAFALIPFVRKTSPALSLYQAVGEHFAHIKGDVAKNERQEFIKKYPKPYLLKAFPFGTRILILLRPVFRWLTKDNGK